MVIFMKRIYVIFILFLMFLMNTEVVKANIICNDGTESPTCKDCHQGCCSWHKGCLRDDGTDTGDISNFLVPAVIGGGTVGAFIYGKKKNTD